MLEKILLYVDDSESVKVLVDWTLKLARQLNIRIFAVFIINRPHSRQPKDLNQEETAWAVLYEIEDSAFEENVKISLILEEGRPEDKLMEILTSFELDGMIIRSQAKLDFKELISRMPPGKVLIIK